MYDHSLVSKKTPKAYRAKLFNLSRAEDCIEYEDILLKIYNGTFESIRNDSHFDIKKGTVKIHLEWVEYETTTQSIYTPDGGD